MERDSSLAGSILLDDDDDLDDDEKKDASEAAAPTCRLSRASDWCSEESVVVPEAQPAAAPRPRRGSFLGRAFGGATTTPTTTTTTTTPTTAPPPAKKKRLVKGYELLGQLGAGAYATVEKCKKGDEVFAVKVFERSRLAKKKQFEKRGQATSALDKVQAEIAIMRKLLGHPNLVRLVESHVDEANDRLYMFMEFVDGGPVMDFDEDAREFRCAVNGTGPCDPRRAMRYAYDVANGLATMHSFHVAHRDLKPANILLCRTSGRCKISDFGVARLFPHQGDTDDDDDNEGDDDDNDKKDVKAEGATTTTSSKSSSLTTSARNLRLAQFQRSESKYLVKGTEGTYAYFAPEMLTTEAFNALACDLWALGVCAFNFLTAKLPFDHQFTDDLFDAIARDEPPYAAYDAFRDDKYVALVKSLLRKDPKLRASIHDVLKNPLVSRHVADNAITLQTAKASRNLALLAIDDQGGAAEEGTTSSEATTTTIPARRSSAPDDATSKGQDTTKSASKRRQSFSAFLRGGPR